MSKTDAVNALGLPIEVVDGILNKKRSVSPDIALRLGRAFNTTPQLWLNLQATFVLWQATQVSDDWQHVGILYRREESQALAMA